MIRIIMFYVLLLFAPAKKRFAPAPHRAGGSATCIAIVYILIICMQVSIYISL